MASSFTTNLNLEKPGIGEQENAWGTTLNTDFDTIDTEFGKTNAGDPNGSVDGDYVGQRLWDTTNKRIWTCIVAGSAGAEAWTGSDKVGTIKMLAYDDTLDESWLECDDAAVSRSTYSLLHSVLKDVGGTDNYGWGDGDGSTTFNVPDLRGRAPIGAGQGNTAEGGGSGTSRSISGLVGAETHTLLTAEMPDHTHTVPSGAPSSENDGGGATTGGSGAQVTGSTGGDGDHNNMGPSACVKFIIYTGYGV